MSLKPSALWLTCSALTMPAFAQNAADDYFDPEDMAAARMTLKHGHGNHLGSLVLAERLELNNNDGDAAMAFEGQAWIGGDVQKLWFKVDAEQDAEETRLEEFEVQALYSRAVSAFWDLQAGIRHDVRPNPQRTYATIGLQGIAPYWFEIDSTLFVSEHGDVSARVEAEYEIRVSQRLLLQPRIEMNMAFSDDDDVGATSGRVDLSSGLRLRYEVTPRFAPYVGVRWQGSIGSNSYERPSGDPFSLVAGVRFWF